MKIKLWVVRLALRPEQAVHDQREDARQEAGLWIVLHVVEQHAAHRLGVVDRVVGGPQDRVGGDRRAEALGGPPLDEVARSGAEELVQHRGWPVQPRGRGGYEGRRVDRLDAHDALRLDRGQGAPPCCAAANDEMGADL